MNTEAVQNFSEKFEYNIDGKKELCATPVVDEDGVLKFTIDELKDNDDVAVVRVKEIETSAWGFINSEGIVRNHSALFWDYT